jgi:plastocyanin
MKRILTVLFATAVIAGTLAIGAVAHSPGFKTMTIRHQMRGCHSWAVAGGRFAPTQRMTLEEGSTLRVVNNDVMPHRFAQTRGAHLQIVHARMSHMGATATVRFNERGVYKFTTKPGEDYPAFQHMKTIGDDYTLRLTVTVH